MTAFSLESSTHPILGLAQVIFPAVIEEGNAVVDRFGHESHRWFIARFDEYVAHKISRARNTTSSLRFQCAEGEVKLRLLLIAVLALSAVAQEILSSIQGKVTGDASLAQTQLSVSLLGTGGSAQNEHVNIDADGSFTFHNVLPGSYIVQLETSTGNVIQRVSAHVTNAEDQIEIQLPAHEKTSAAAGSTVSVSQLLHPLSGKSRKLFTQAHQASQKGDYIKSIALLRQTFNDPAAHPYAHINIGADFIQLGDVDSAILEFEEASRLAPGNALAHRNLAYALLMKTDYPAAEIECRRSLEIEKTNARTNWVMAVILLDEGGHDNEAIADLHYASRELPRARLVLADYYQRKGEDSLAAQELRAALPDVAPREQQTITHLLSSLAAK